MDRVPHYLRMIRDYDYATYLHCNRVAEFAYQIGQKVSLNSIELNQLVSAARLHDLGKINIEKSILHKPGNLSTDEWKEIRKHSEYGVRILSSDCQFESKIIASIHSHHEYYNGKGYPKGIKNESINIYARIISIADAFDAMTTNRTYRSQNLTPNQAIQEILRCSGTQFDPNLTKILTSIDINTLSYSDQLL
ncbi:MAG: HD domain-containing phosphohydrolase [Syntrophomonas sp.]